MHQGQRRNNDAGHVPPALPGRNPAQTTTMPFAQRLTCTIAEACQATGLGRTKLYELIGDGCLVTTTIGRRRLVLVRSLQLLIDGKTG